MASPWFEILDIWAALFLSASLPSLGVLSFLGGSRGELGTTLLGILPDGYSLWIRAKSQPGLECVCWTVHCISGDHTGSISMSKSLCCPLSLSQHVPQGSRVRSSIPAGNLCLEVHIHPATNYPSTSLYAVYDCYIKSSFTRYNHTKTVVAHW